MEEKNLPSAELLKTVLEPLLEDFQFWFKRSQTLLETERMEFMSDQEQSDLLLRLKKAIAELSTAKMLFDATNGQVGIDMAILMPWHQLLTECWKVGRRFHQEKQV